MERSRSGRDDVTDRRGFNRLLPRVCDGTAPSTDEVKDRGGTRGRFHTKRASAAARKAGRQAPPAGAVGAATSGEQKGVVPRRFFRPPLSLSPSIHRRWRTE
jgi:hypothetical protein